FSMPVLASGAASSSPRRRPNAISSGSLKVWLRTTITRLSSHAWRSAAKPAASSARKSPHRTSAPSGARCGITSTGADCAADARIFDCVMRLPALFTPRRAVPVHDFLAGPEHDAALLLQRGEHLFEILDAKRRARNVRMDGDRHDFRARR